MSAIQIIELRGEKPRQQQQQYITAKVCVHKLQPGKFSASSSSSGGGEANVCAHKRHGK
jgi:hypothetical protein